MHYSSINIYVLKSNRLYLLNVMKVLKYDNMYGSANRMGFIQIQINLPKKKKKIFDFD